MQIQALSAHEPVVFAAEEIGRCVEQSTGRPASVRVTANPDADTLRIGLEDAFPDVTLPAVDDHRFDDAIHVAVDGEGRGTICGNTPRAVLQAAYRYLREIGCHWVRPGPDGEVILNHDAIPAVSLAETPAYRHRALSISGDTDEDRIRELVDWAPKVGYNSAMIEFQEGELFKKARDRRQKHPAEPSEPLSDERALALHETALEAMEQRGLLYHGVGHNWTARVLGVGDQPREPDIGVISEDRRSYLAQLDGERTLFGRGPLDTELCYSNDEVRSRFVESVVDYATRHPEIDVLHVWLSDGHNNHCECARCRGTRPTDFYVKILNELDKELTDADLDHRIAFLAYTDLLWPPVEERIDNEDRFLLMFAPIRRTYTDDYGEVQHRDVPSYERNELEFPTDVSTNVSLLDAWRSTFHGDGFVFDYHFWMAHLRDPGSMQIGQLAARDMRHLQDIGLNGSVSCNGRRVFFPTGLGMRASVAVLWDRRTSFDGFADEYLEAAYGADYESVREYLETLSEAFDQAYLVGEKAETDERVANTYSTIPETVGSFQSTIRNNRERTTGVYAQSWRDLELHADLCIDLARALAARAHGDEKKALKEWNELKTSLRERGDLFVPFFDLHLFETQYDRIFEPDG